MRNTIVFALLLTGCSGGGSAPSSKAKAVWPLANAIQTSTFGGYSCAVTSAKGVSCYDGTTVYTQGAPYDSSAAVVVVGNGIACLVVDSAGVPAACLTNLTDPACVNPAPNASVVCWTPSNQTPVVMDIPGQTGYGNSANYIVGNLDLTVNVAGTVCATEAIFDASNNNYLNVASSCGTAISVLNYLQ